MKESFTYVAYIIFPLAWTWLTLILIAAVHDFLRYKDEFLQWTVLVLIAFVSFVLFMVVLNAT